jgi:GDP-L-fucose synthase
MNSDAAIFVAGARGLVGSALVRTLRRAGYSKILATPRAELDLRDGAATEEYFRRHRPEYVFLAAARVGGIAANSAEPAEFLADNLAIQLSVICAAHRHDVRKLLFLGSSCIYPKFAAQPIQEAALLTGPLEPTNEAYAIAKIAGIKLCQSFRRQYGRDYIAAMPTNLYGPGDNFDTESSHVLPALIRKFHEAVRAEGPEVLLWGSGAPLREFLHVDDLAAACLLLMKTYSDESIINIGSGEEVSIRQLAELVASVSGYRGAVRFDPSRPDGTPRKLIDSTRIRALGWAPSISLEEGVRSTYAWYASQAAH